VDYLDKGFSLKFTSNMFWLESLTFKYTSIVNSIFILGLLLAMFIVILIYKKFRIPTLIIEGYDPLLVTICTLFKQRSCSSIFFGRFLLISLPSSVNFISSSISKRITHALAMELSISYLDCLLYGLAIYVYIIMMFCILLFGHKQLCKDMYFRTSLAISGYFILHYLIY